MINYFQNSIFFIQITQPGQEKVRNRFKKQFNKQKGDRNQNKVKQINGEFQGTKFNDKKVSQIEYNPNNDLWKKLMLFYFRKIKLIEDC